MKNTIGQSICITLFGESHGREIGCVIDGIAPGIAVDENYIASRLSLRRPSGLISTQRHEPDEFRIVSGVRDGRACGTPICILIPNTDTRSSDYESGDYLARPGHADYTFDQKYGFRDYRGGGRSSGRETIGRVAAGAVAVKILNELGITFITYTKSIGPIAVSSDRFNFSEVTKNPLYMPDAEAAENAENYLDACMAELNSSGGIVECIIKGMPAGIGDPVFEKLNANLAKAVMSIGAVKGFEIGDGFDVAKATGKNNNDAFVLGEDGRIAKATNHAGGILGGMSDGSDIILRAAIKPTPSIAATQRTVNQSGEEISVNIKGRHDPIIVPRAVVVVESMAAITIVDALFSNMSARMDALKDFYS